MTEDLERLGKPIADTLIPGWRVEWLWSTQEELDAIIPGAMAICSTTPTRSMALVRVLSPWPAGESLVETLWHELTHAAWSPLTSLIPASDGATMVEEQIVERFGVLLSKLTPGLARVVARAMRVVAMGACSVGHVRAAARISALATPRARSGGTMSPEIMKKILEVMTSGDAAGALALLPEIVAAEAGGGAAAPEGPESAPPGAPMGAAPAAGAEDPAKKEDAPMARQHARAQAAATSLVGTSIRARIHEVRTVDGIAIAPEVEKRLAACDSVEAAESMISTIKDTIAANGGQVSRARSGAQPPGGKQGPVEGMTPRERATYAGLVTGNPKAAEQYADECAKNRARTPKAGAK